MTVSSGYLAFPSRGLSTRGQTGQEAAESFRRPKCPRCGSVLLIAEESRYNARGRIDHVWSCDDCGHAFVTSIRLGLAR
jgi:RNase P subunit RPR2